jgi:hypothetical protein
MFCLDHEPERSCCCVSRHTTVHLAQHCAKGHFGLGLVDLLSYVCLCVTGSYTASRACWRHTPHRLRVLWRWCILEPFAWFQPWIWYACACFQSVYCLISNTAEGGKLLVCAVLLGRPFMCSDLMMGAGRMPSYDSHIAPSGLEVSCECGLFSCLFTIHVCVCCCSTCCLTRTEFCLSWYSICSHVRFFCVQP